MFNRMMREKYYCGLDIGSKKIKASVLHSKDSEHVELLGACERTTHGFKDASVTDLGELTECIHATVEQLLKKTDVKIKEFYVGIGGASVDARETNTVIPLIDKGNKVIAQRDIKKVNGQARLLGMKMEEEILHDAPQYYQVDDINSALNPLGLYGRKLGVHSLMIIINGNRVRNIIKAIQQAGYDVADVAFSTYTSSEIALNEDDRTKGTVLVDIGAEVTSVLILKDGVLKFMDKIPVGGEHFSRNIAEHIQIPFNLAEEIKLSYAVALKTERHQSEEILVRRKDQYVPVKREQIYNAIEPQIIELVQSIRSAIRISGLYDQINRGITLIGGGALLPGIIERIAEETNLSAKLGQLGVITDHKLSNAATFASVVGLALQGFNKNSLGVVISSNGHSHWAKKAAQKMRDLYQEYF